MTPLPFSRPKKGECPECGGSGWRRYYSETPDGNFEEAFELCPCNHKPETPGKRACEESERPKSTAEDLPTPVDRDAEDLL